MRYILIILVFLSVGAKAQMVIKAHANYRPYASPAVNLLLDDYPNAAAAYSLRKLDKDYAGSAIRVRRSNDNAESDIGFTSGGDLDTATLKTFVGANSGFVVTWYDQSGNGRNATQATAANQPRIVNAGVVQRLNSKPILDFDGSNDNLSVPSSTSYFNFFHNGTSSFISFVGNLDATGINQTRLLLENMNFATQNIGILLSTFGNYRIAQQMFRGQAVNPYSIDNQTNTNIISSSQFILNINTDADNATAANRSEIYINNGNAIKNNTSLQNITTSNATNNLCIGASAGGPGAGGSSTWDGSMQEILIYGSDQSSNRTGISNNINDYYNIYWNGDFTGLLDTYGSSAAAYSLRNLSSTYTGPLVRVRRSNDNAEQDIFGDYYGNLDTAALKTFVGANNGFVTTWYDQSGNTRNHTNTVATEQPRIALNGTIERNNGEVAILFDGSNDVLQLPANTTIFQNVSSGSIYSVHRYVSNPTTAKIIYFASVNTNEGTTRFGLGGGLTSNRHAIIARRLDADGASVLSGLTATNTTNQILISAQCDWANGDGFIYLNTSSEATNTSFTTNGNTSNTNSINSCIGAIKTDNNTNVNNINAHIFEIIIYNNINNRTDIESNINTYYGIY